LSKKKVVILSGVVALAAVLCGVLIFKTTPNKKQDILNILPGGVDLEIKDFVYTEVGENKVKWEVRAKSASYDRKQNLALLEKVQIKLTTADGKVFEMTADEGRMDTKQKDLEIKKNVLIRSDAGDRFTTENIRYRDSEKKFYTDAPVMMENSKMKITGRGLVLRINQGELDIQSKVKARIQ